MPIEPDLKVAMKILNEIIKRLLRRVEFVVAGRTTGQNRDKVKLNIVSGRGLRPGVRLDHSAKLLDTMEQAD